MKDMVSFLPNFDTSELDDKLLKGRYMRLLEASELQAIPFELFKVWCHKNCRYGIVTLELIKWLKEIIGNQKCIEVGAGCGDLGHHLNIIQTDSKLQEFAPAKKLYNAIGQPTIRYPDSIRKFDALDAVLKYQPDVVIASWVTQFVDKDDDPGKSEANMWEVKENEIIKHVKIYIMIGNENIHETKKILSLPHEKYYFPWLVSRAIDQSKNVIYVWRKNDNTTN